MRRGLVINFEGGEQTEGNMEDDPTFTYETVIYLMDITLFVKIRKELVTNKEWK